MRRHAGFTLIEVMIVVAIVAILATVAYPAYDNDYTRRGKIAEATSQLAGWRARMEQYFLDNRTYLNAGGACGVPVPTGAEVKYFAYNLPGPTANTYTLTATGVAGEGMGGFTYGRAPPRPGLHGRDRAELARDADRRHRVHAF